MLFFVIYLEKGRGGVIMKSLFYFFVTCIVATIMFLGALTMDNPLLGISLGMVIWVCFIRYISR